MKILHCVAFTLLIVGGLNLGLVALFNFNLVSAILGSFPALEQVLYILVGASAVYMVATHAKDCKACKGCCTK